MGTKQKSNRYPVSNRSNLSKSFEFANAQPPVVKISNEQIRYDVETFARKKFNDAPVVFTRPLLQEFF